MVYIRGGRVLEGNESATGLGAVLAWFWALLNGIVFFLQTLVSPDGTSKYQDHRRKKGWGGDRRGPGGGGPGGGGGGGGGGGPRISGMGNLPSSKNPPCGPGGCCGG